jgi:D-ribose pyranase
LSPFERCERGRIGGRRGEEPVKKTGILHPDIARLLCSLGHGDGLCIADAGLPIPASVSRIDLALVPGLPGFLSVLDAVLAELVVEAAVVAEETRTRSPQVYEQIVERLGIHRIQEVPHDEFKESVGATRGVIRSGECTPYANIILKSGVAF